jgi:cation transport regulator ChaB
MLIDFPDEQPYAVTSAIEWIRVRVHDPENFKKDSFRTIWFSETKGIKAIIGKKKGETVTSVQAVLFDKEKFSEKEANQWVKDRYGRVNAYVDFCEWEDATVVGQPVDSNDIIWKEVNLEIAPYDKNSDLPSSVQQYSEKSQTAFRKAWNKAFQTYKNESTAFKVAWSVLKRTEKKEKSSEEK